MESKKIRITCDVATTMPIDDLEAFQGKLKSITEAEFEKLKSAILKYGFSFPVFVWRKSILDGHQRVQAVKRLIDDGYELEGGMLPVALIKAKDRKEAAEKLLLINSRYAKIDQDGFDFFVQDFDIDVVDMSGLLEIPEISFLPLEDGDIDYNDEWDGMPEFDQQDEKPYRTLLVHFLNEKDLQKFLKLIDQQITERTKYLYFPKRERNDSKSVGFVTEDES